MTGLSLLGFVFWPRVGLSGFIEPGLTDTQSVEQGRGDGVEYWLGSERLEVGLRAAVGLAGE